MFHVTILNPKHVVYEGDAESVLVPGDQGEFEILDYHMPIVSLLKPGKVKIDWKKIIRIKNGMVKFNRGDCVMLVEE